MVAHYFVLFPIDFAADVILPFIELPVIYYFLVTS